MRVEIGRYKNWFGPYQFSRKVFFFLSEDMQDKIADWLPVGPFEWFDKKFKQRHIIIEIDGYDTWSADHTLSLIIHPLLVKFRQDVTCYPMSISNEDVPDEIWNQPNLLEDEINLRKWEWILDEMIWTFERIKNQDEETEPYFISNPDTGKFTVDKEKLKAHEERLSRGLILFGKYFRNLWN
jgi:hypothetical protein